MEKQLHMRTNLKITVDGVASKLAMN